MNLLWNRQVLLKGGAYPTELALPAKGIRWDTLFTSFILGKLSSAFIAMRDWPFLDANPGLEREAGIFYPWSRVWFSRPLCWRKTSTFPIIQCYVIYHSLVSDGRFIFSRPYTLSCVPWAASRMFLCRWVLPEIIYCTAWLMTWSLTSLSGGSVSFLTKYSNLLSAFFPHFSVATWRTRWPPHDRHTGCVYCIPPWAVIHLDFQLL